MARDKKKNAATRAELSALIKSNFEAAISLGVGHLPESYDSVYNSFNERLALYTSDCIVTFSKSLNLPIYYTATALGYFQCYKSIPESSWNKHTNAVFKKFNGSIGNDLGSHILAAACILLAWKYREDESSNPKCIKKLFELSSGIYRLIVSSAINGSAKISTSKWILDTGGSELKRLKNLISICENNLLHSLNYYVGPIGTPFALINNFTNRFLVTIERISTDDQLEILHKKLKPTVSLALLDCCKTSMYIDFTGRELVLACILKAIAILNIPPLETANSDVRDDQNMLLKWDQTIEKFITTCMTGNNNCKKPDSIESIGVCTCNADSCDQDWIHKRLGLALSQMRYFQQVAL